MTLGPVRVMVAGVAVLLCVVEVSSGTAIVSLCSLGSWVGVKKSHLRSKCY